MARFTDEELKELSNMPDKDFQRALAEKMKDEEIKDDSHHPEYDEGVVSLD